MGQPVIAARPARARLGTCVVFLAAGSGIGAWAACIPGIKLGLGLTDAELGVVLLSVAGGSILGMPLAGWLGHRFDPHRVSVAMGLAFCLSVMLPPWGRGCPR